MKSILDPTFRYVPSTSTDLRKTFARVRREMQKQREAEVERVLNPPRVIPLKERKDG